MSLIKSISGIRGTIGGKTGNNLTPIEVVNFSTAYATWCEKNSLNNTIVIGRDARKSGKMVANLVCGCLVAKGFSIIDLGISTTPTVEMMVPESQAAGGIILTASHNPEGWNALKLLNEKGEFLSAAAGAEILEIAEKMDFNFVAEDKIGSYVKNKEALSFHIEKILELPNVQTDLIKQANFKVAFDAINSSGGIAIPLLLEKLGVQQIIGLNDEPTGQFAHTPEPLPQNLTDIMQLVAKEKADVGFVVDPDVDRLAIICEDGSYFGEEYTLVAIADYMLSKIESPTVSNLSSSRALKDITEQHGQLHYNAAVGEVNVVEKMKEVGAKIGGEGNGGIILPELHYGRDALVGIALFLSFMAEKQLKVSDIRKQYPNYVMVKDKVQLKEGLNLDEVLQQISENYKEQPQNKVDGVKIEFEDSWVHLRKSNTEPIIRIYAEHNNQENCVALAEKFKGELLSLI